MSAVVMGDPGAFEILHGSNPHTRNLWGMRKSVNRSQAAVQWKTFAEQLRAAGVQVHVMPAVPDCPGLVYPANAGIIAAGCFYPSNLLPSRASERPHYEEFFVRLGFSVKPFGGGMIPFEGEADFFPWGGRTIFTHGRIERQRLTPSWRFPFYRRVYGFRSDVAALDELRKIVPSREILALELCDERYYHGDTCLCSFGPRREFLMAYMPALTGPSRETLNRVAADKLIEMGEADAAVYAANSFAATIRGAPHLFMPEQASGELKRRITDLGVTLVEISVSEFLKKGGGSVKCMVFDLGET